ncbi:MAG: molybdopterin-synthase adenylyltransferase MoeB [Chloroflexi bacterium]|nr:molybdopterin-synthase adenylyltransferase MoeB [Chloroflexota bacterium]
MIVRIYVPTSFRRYAGGQANLVSEAPTVGALLDDLQGRYPALSQQIIDDRGQIFRHVNIYVNSVAIDSLQGTATALQDGDEVAVIPAIAGGAVASWTEEQVKRYSRHILLPEVGGLGQKKLLRSKVLLIGAGGLGSPAALYLGAAGVGTLGIVDFDRVDLSNLQRQIIHRFRDVDRLKVESAEETLNNLNPDVEVVGYPVQLTSENVMEIIADYDVVVDGADNFPTRYLINDACYFAGKPLVHGSIFRFEGQATVFKPGEGCYRCLFPAPPPPGAVPSCAEAGVLGVLPGVVGVIQAIEAIKLLLDIGQPLVGRLLLFDALAMEFREVKIRHDHACPLCGDQPTVTGLIDYEAFCGVPTAVPS